jgi:hypothetical protein
MRKAIRLTGRRQLPVSAFDFQLRDVGDSQVATLTLADPGVARLFPLDASVRVKLTENKRVEILRFGTLGDLKIDLDVPGVRFQAPSCQIRIVKNAEPDGLLLGSTVSWTYKTGSVQEGILQFQPADVRPRLWRLDIRDEEFPIVYLDRQLPDATNWATTPTFAALVLPTVVKEIFRHIWTKTRGVKPDDGWMAHWLAWAESIAPGHQWPRDNDEAEVWFDGLVETFLQRHGIAGLAIAELSR